MKIRDLRVFSRYNIKGGETGYIKPQLNLKKEFDVNTYIEKGKALR